MPEEIRVPQLGESVVEATITRWLKPVGAPIHAGDVLAELETDKVNVEVTAETSGTLASILRKEGDSVTVNEVIATIAASNGAPALAPQSPVMAPPASAPSPEPSVAPAESFAARNKPVTPVAQNVAVANGIDLKQIAGTGPQGKVLKHDVEAAIRQTDRDVAATEPPEISPAARAAEQDDRPAQKPFDEESLAPILTESPREERRPLSRLRQTIADRLVHAQHTAAMLTTFNEVNMSAIMDLRKRRKDSFKEVHGIGLGFMSFFTKAVVGALKAYPIMNAEIQGHEMVLKKYYDIGIAVSTPTGLVVPVVRDADQMTFADVEKEILMLATRARENKLTLAELAGGTFTVTNGGVFGSLLSTPILNAPQVGILGMHKIEERPIAENGQVVIRPMMYLALSYDHRLVDGSEAVRFLVKVKELIEDPEALLLEG